MIVAAGILIGSITMSAGVLVIPRSTQPAFTLNICEPLQVGIALSGNPVARPAFGLPKLLLLEHKRVIAEPLQPVTDLIIEPESPPPKSLT
jgi:hypothetical protein